MLMTSRPMRILNNKLPIILAILLYILIYFLRLQQGGWDIKLDLFKSQREYLDKQIQSYLPSPQSELLSGILLGQSKNLPGSLKLVLRDTSTLHIVVASGQNLTIVAGFVLSLAGLIKRKTALILALGVCMSYTALSGMQLPILRAAIMFIFASLAQLIGRPRQGWWVLIVTAGIMLLINPTWLTNLSFQLSFLATFGVIVISPIFNRLFSKIPIIGQDLAVTLAAQIMVMPVISQNFHQISLVSLIVNVLVLWTISFIMIGGVLMLAVGFIWSGLGQLTAVLVSVLLTYLIDVISFFGKLPFAWEYIGEQVWVFWVGYYMLIAAIVLSLNNVQKDH